MTTNKEIGARIKAAREQKGVTLQEVARDIGVAKSTILRYENGSIESIKLPVISAIALSLEVDPAWLLLKTDRPKSEKPALKEDELSDAERELISLLRQIPPEQSALVLNLAKEFAQAQKKT